MMTTSMTMMMMMMAVMFQEVAVARGTIDMLSKYLEVIRGSARIIVIRLRSFRSVAQLVVAYSGGR